MDGLHQSVGLNPAYQSSCNTFIGLPAISGVNLNAAHTGFSFQDLIHLGTGNLADSLIIDINNIKDKLGKNNYIIAETDIPILALGFWSKNNYITINLTNKTKARMAYPGDLINLIDGNANFIGDDNPLEITDFGPDAINYNELSFGLSKKLTHRLFVGARFKLLSGLGSIASKKSNITLVTDEDTYNMHLETEFDYYVSAPVSFNVNDDGQVDDIDVFEGEDIIKDLLKVKNMGVGIDLGATYQFSDNIKFYASVTDLGFIRWGANTANLKQKASYDFNGFNLDSISTNPDYEFEAIADTLQELMKYTYSTSKYSTPLNSNVYLGATYSVTDFLNFGFLSRTAFYDRKPHQSFMVSANLRPAKWFSTTVSYSYANRSFKNLGFGLTIGGPFQFYILTDNLIAAINPKNTRSVGFQLGFNLKFGCGKRDDYSIMNNKKLKKDIDFM